MLRKGAAALPVWAELNTSVESQVCPAPPVLCCYAEKGSWCIYDLWCAIDDVLKFFGAGDIIACVCVCVNRSSVLICNRGSGMGSERRRVLSDGLDARPKRPRRISTDCEHLNRRLALSWVFHPCVRYGVCRKRDTVVIWAFVHH